MAKERGIMQRMIQAIAEHVADHPLIPPENKEPLKLATVKICEHIVCSMIGTDTLRVSGWIIHPSARQDRRDRIEQALLAGEAPKAIAGRELVSERHVRKLRAELVAAGTMPP